MIVYYNTNMDDPFNPKADTRAALIGANKRLKDDRVYVQGAPPGMQSVAAQKRLKQMVGDRKKQKADNAKTAADRMSQLRFRFMKKGEKMKYKYFRKQMDFFEKLGVPELGDELLKHQMKYDNYDPAKDPYADLSYEQYLKEIEKKKPDYDPELIDDEAPPKKKRGRPRKQTQQTEEDILDEEEWAAKYYKPSDYQNETFPSFEELFGEEPPPYETGYADPETYDTSLPNMAELAKEMEEFDKKVKRKEKVIEPKKPKEPAIPTISVKELLQNVKDKSQGLSNKELEKLLLEDDEDQGVDPVNKKQNDIMTQEFMKELERMLKKENPKQEFDKVLKDLGPAIAKRQKRREDKIVDLINLNSATYQAAKKKLNTAMEYTTMLTKQFVELLPFVYM